jgi:hypothetical protein
MTGNCVTTRQVKLVRRVLELSLRQSREDVNALGIILRSKWDLDQEAIDSKRLKQRLRAETWSPHFLDFWVSTGPGHTL